MLKGALHVHTNYSDGAFPPEEILDMYRGLGFGFVALTDHEYLAKKHDMSDIPDRVGDMLVFKGLELEPIEMMYHHVLYVPGEKEVLRVLCHPDAYHMTVAAVSEKIKTAPWPIDAVEITYQGFYTPIYDTPEIKLPKVATDDTHEEWAVGRAWIELDCDLNRDIIIKEIKLGRFRNRFR